MYPNMFAIDWARLGEVLIVIVVLVFFIERALALLFESRAFIDHFEGKSHLIMCHTNHSNNGI